MPDRQGFHYVDGLCLQLAEPIAVAMCSLTYKRQGVDTLVPAH